MQKLMSCTSFPRLYICLMNYLLFLQFTAHLFTYLLLFPWHHFTVYWKFTSSYILLTYVVTLLLCLFSFHNFADLFEIYSFGCTAWLNDWVNDWLNGWMIGWLTDWLIDWLTDWLSDRLADLLTYSLTHTSNKPQRCREPEKHMKVTSFNPGKNTKQRRENHTCLIYYLPITDLCEGLSIPVADTSHTYLVIYYGVIAPTMSSSSLTTEV